MSSSTSNSSLRQLKPTLLLATGLLLGYELLVRLSLVPSGDGTSMQSVNIVRVEQFLQQLKNGQSTVLTGSSLAGNLQQGVWQDGMANIGQSGGNSLTGLELILRQPNMPARVVVDVSTTLLLGLDESVFVPLQPLSYFGNKLFKCTQESYKPTNVVLSALRRKVGKGSEPPLLEDVRRASIQQIVSANADPMDAELKLRTSSALSSLRVKVDSLTKRGVKVVLVSIPTQPEVDQTIRRQQFVQLAHEVFPESLGYQWLKISNREYQTSDGVHLVQADAKTVRQEILNGL